MGDKGNPWDAPGWHSMGREAKLVRHLLGSGVTSLGKANYADKTGEYYTAFFGLAIGLERLAKLILVADYAIASSGAMPDEKYVRKYGHKLSKLLNVVDDISKKRNMSLEYCRPTTEISAVIVECLDAFADAGRGRYANFAALGDPNLGEEEPIRKWWDDVAHLILIEHYYGKPAQRRIEGNAKLIDELLSPVTFILHFSEEGEVMNDVLCASIRTGQTELVQRYGRFYTLTVIRWLSDVFSELARTASDVHGIHAFFGAWEHFYTYRVDNKLLRTRKNWPLN